MSQLAYSVSILESQGILPSQIVVNPKHHISEITLIGEKELKEPSKMKSREEAEKDVIPQLDQSNKLNGEQLKALAPTLHFSYSSSKSKKEEEEEIFDTFCKVEVSAGENVSTILQKKLPLNTGT
ncbi:hypothetical protein PTKIN_Ptkin09bG0153500 [Pterospermum kingtungense]